MHKLRRRNVMGDALALVATASFGRAAVAQGEGALTRIAFGSCADQERPQPVWKAVLDYRPELFLFMGDNVYGDVSSGEMLELRSAYERAEAIGGYRQVRTAIRCLATWDDHDFGRNDAGAEFPYKEEAKALFLAFWRAAAEDPRRAREGVYDAHIIGPEGRRIQVVMLDTRWFRIGLMASAVRAVAGRGRYIPDDDAGGSMLGEAQWAWLAAELRKPAELRLIVSSIQVLAEGHNFERWGNLPRERQRLFDLIAETRANGVVFLSGDRHMAAIYETAADTPYRFVELTSSGLNQVWPDPTDLQGNRLGEPYAAPNFGTVDVDWDTGTIRLEARGLDSQPAREIVVSLAALRARD